MNFLRYFYFYLVIISTFISCNNSKENKWNIEVNPKPQKIEITDISKEFYDQNIPLETFKQKYPWFQGTVTDEDYNARRKDADEIKIYHEAVANVKTAQLKADLENLFAHIRHYFPKFKNPKVFLYSSALQSIQDPIFYQPQENMLFIDISAFMCEKNPMYEGLDLYFLKTMNPQNIVPKVSQIFAETIIQPDLSHQKFLDKMVNSGKIMILQDAFLPKTPDYLKINYTPQQYEWAIANDANVWNYFVEKNLIFSDDPRLDERFFAVAPFSKFYTEIDNQSSPQIGIFTGWQICKKYFQQKPDTKLVDFLNLSSEGIFKESGYKPE